MYSRTQKQTLMSTARSSIQHGMQSGKPEDVNIKHYDAELQAIRATFVTLKIDTTLRGCIGTTEAREPLIRSVAEYAYAAAFRDPRFKPLSPHEFDEINLSISILTPVEVIEFKSDADLVQQLQPHVDGLIIQAGHRSATFLPSVWSSLSDAEAFFSQLKTKARISVNENLTAAWRYRAIEISENEI